MTSDDVASFDDLLPEDPAWSAAYARMATQPWTSGVLPRRLVELVCVGLSAACTARDGSDLRRHVRAALAAGATPEEVGTVLKMAALLAIHSCSLGAPLLLEALGPDAAPEPPVPTPVGDRMRAAGQWNPAWDAFADLAPAWTEAFMAVGGDLYLGGALPPKEVELLSVAFDAAVTHLYAPGTKRHIVAALANGATAAEVMAVLQLCVAFGAVSLRLGGPILAEEWARRCALGGNAADPPSREETP